MKESLAPEDRLIGGVTSFRTMQAVSVAQRPARAVSTASHGPRGSRGSGLRFFPVATVGLRRMRRRRALPCIRYRCPSPRYRRGFPKRNCMASSDFSELHVGWFPKWGLCWVPMWGRGSSRSGAY